MLMLQSLIERGPQLDRVESALSDAARGSGRVLVIAGPPGIGKTALLRAACESSSERGMAVLRATASELESDSACGVVRQLFEPALAAASPSGRKSLLRGVSGHAVDLLGLLPPTVEGAAGDRAVRDPPDPPRDPHARLDAIVRGLYWLVAGFSERSPLLIAVDDAQLCDPPSGRFLAYLARRLEDLPVALVTIERASEDDAAKVAMPELDATAKILTLPSLSAAGSAELVRQDLSGDAHPLFCEACHAATGGNPFLLHELVEQLRADGIEATAAAAEHVRGLVPAGVARAVIGRIGRLGADAIAVAQAAAVLGAGAHLRWVIGLAEISERAAPDAIDALVAAGIARYEGVLELAHPLTHGAVYGSIPAARRGLMHLRAARLREREGAELDRVASHLLVAPAAGDQVVVEHLRQAAAVADCSGAPEIASRYLQRALAEPALLELRTKVIVELARAQIRAGDSKSVANLSRALDAETSTHERASLGLELGRSMLMVDRPADALTVFRRARAELRSDDAALTAELEAEEVGTALLDVSTAGPAIEQLLRLPRRSPANSLGDRLLLAYEAYFRASRGAPIGEVLDVVRRAQVFGAGSHDSVALATRWGSLVVSLGSQPILAMRSLASQTRVHGSVARRAVTHTRRRRKASVSGRASRRPRIDDTASLAPSDRQVAGFAVGSPCDVGPCIRA
jgi:hypothetical protein